MQDEEVQSRWPLATATVAVAAVAAVAGVVSYSHMYEVGLVAGEQWRAWILPVSVDGLVIAATLNAWRARQARVEVAGATVTALAVGLLVSILANIAAPFLPDPAHTPDGLSAVVAAWPPVALALALEELIRMRRALHPVPAQPPNRAGTPESVPAQPAQAGAAGAPERQALDEEVTTDAGSEAEALPSRQSGEQQLSGSSVPPPDLAGTRAGIAVSPSAEHTQELPAPEDLWTADERVGAQQRGRERVSARELVRAEPDAWSGAALAERFGRSERWGRMQISAAREDMR